MANDSAKTILAPGLAMVIAHANPQLAIRNDIAISLRCIGEFDYDDGINVPIAALLEDFPGENSFSIWLYEPGDPIPKEMWIKESFPCAIPMLTNYIKQGVERVLRTQAIESLDGDWYYNNSGQVRSRVAHLCELWEGMAHRGVRDVDNELTIPYLSEY